MLRSLNVRYAGPILTGALAIGTVSFAIAQESGGMTVNLSVEQSLEYSDNPDFVANPDNAGFLSSTRLGFSLDSATRIQTFSLSGGGLFEATPGGDAEFEESNARFRYNRATGNSSFGLTGNYRNVDLNDVFSILLPVEDEILIDDNVGVTDPTIIVSDGSRTQKDLGLSFATGLQGPVTFRLNLSTQERSYSNTTDANLFDNRTDRASASASFRINPTLTARLTASRSEYTAEDDVNTDRTITRYGGGLNMAVSETLTLDSFIGYRDTQTRTSTGDTNTTGAEFSLGANRSLKNGTLGFRLDSAETITGRRTTAVVSRSMTLSNEADLAYSLGVLKNEGLSATPLATLSYARAFKRSDISLNFSQEGRTNTDEQAVVISRLNASYSRPLTDRTRMSLSMGVLEENALDDAGEDRSQILLRANVNTRINSVSSWSANVTFSDTDVDDLFGTENQQRVGMRLGYRRSLTKDWAMVASLSHNRLTSTTQADRSENAISIGLSRSFLSRP